MKKLVTMATLLVASHAYADSSQQVDAAVADMAKELAPEYSTFKRDVFVYHWNPRKYVQGAESGDVRYDHARGPEYVEAKVLWTFRPEKTDDGMTQFGPSFYSATNPRVSEDFGNPDGLLIELRLPAGMTYLDDRSPVTFSSQLQSELRQLGCNQTQLAAMFKDGNRRSPCFAIATRFVAVAGIDAIGYGFRDSSVEGCPNQTSTAFTLMNSHVARAGNVHAFLPHDTPDDGANAERARVQDLYSHVHSNQSTPDVLWSNVGRSAVNLSSWQGEHLFGCDLSKHPEDRPPNGSAKNQIPLNFGAKTPSWDEWEALKKQWAQGGANGCAPDGSNEVIAPPVQSLMNAVNGATQ